MDSGGVSLDATASQALSVSPVGRVGDAIDTAKKTDMSNIASDVSSSPSSSGLNLDQASEISRAPWMQSDSPFVSTASGIPSTSTATSTTMKTSSEINMQRKQKEKAEGSVRSASKKSVSTKDTVENDNDVEWIVDSFNADAPERTEATVTGMSSSGRSVNRRRQQQLQQPQAPVALSTQESRIMKARLDELRKANGLYVSDGSNEAVEQKLIDKFK